jgi:hypothetical protein
LENPTYVRRQIAGPRVLQRKCACGNGGGSAGACDSCADEKQKKIQRRALDAAETEIPASVDRVLQSPGRALDHDTRAAMESRFGHDFSRVRVHTDTHAAASAREIHAAAFTSGTHIVFGDRRFEPQTRDGRLLLAHELAHVVQQHGPSRIPIGVGPADDVHERAADRMASDVVAQGAAFAPKPFPRPNDRRLRREWDDRSSAADDAFEREADLAAIAVTSGRDVQLQMGDSAPGLQRSWLGTLLDFTLLLPVGIYRLGGGEYYFRSTLESYLKGIREKKTIEDEYDSDNKARACVKREGELGPYSADDRVLLIEEMLSGYTSGADEGAILVLLRGARRGEAEQIVARLGRHRLWSNFTGQNRRILEALTLTASDATDALVERLRNLEPDELQDYTANNNDPALGEIFRRAAALHNITAPVRASVTVSPAGAATFRINGIDVTAEPDERSTDPAMGSSNITRVELRPVDQGQMFMDENHIVTEFRPLRYLPFVHTIWGPQTVITDRSGYGRGTTSEDVAAGNTSIRFHESRHAQNWFDYLGTHSIPQFTGRVGMTEDQFRQARRDLEAAVQRYTREAQEWSHQVTDCVGTLPSAKLFREANVTSSAVTNAASLCRQGGGQ